MGWGSLTEKMVLMGRWCGGGFTGEGHEKFL
jgi:hypothetical protein